MDSLIEAGLKQSQKELGQRRLHLRVRLRSLQLARLEQMCIQKTKPIGFP
jgi:hypothetical protein